MQHDRLSRSGNLQIWPVLSQQFLKSADRSSDRIRLGAVKQRRHLITQSQRTGWLQPDNGNASSNKGVQCGHETLRFGARTINHPS